MALSERQRQMCEESEDDFSDLSALFPNCTLKPSPQQSHTRGLIDVSAAIMEANDVDVEVLRPVDHDIAPCVYPVMTEHGWETDGWPAIQGKVMDAEILVLSTPIWLGERDAIGEMDEFSFSRGGVHFPLTSARPVAGRRSSRRHRGDFRLCRRRNGRCRIST